jgi:hypothetical protein
MALTMMDSQMPQPKRANAQKNLGKAQQIVVPKRAITKPQVKPIHPPYQC